MEVSLNHANLLIFSKSLHCISKLCNDIIFDFNTSGLILRALSTTESAYAHYYYSNSYFNTINIYHNEAIQHKLTLQPNSIQSIIKCKLSIKLLLFALKQINNVQLCNIILNKQKSILRIELIDSATSIKRIYKFNFLEEYKISQADVSRTNSTTHINITAKTLLYALNTFSTHINEITITCKSTSCIISSYQPNINNQHELQKIQLDTQYEINSNEFTVYQVDSSLVDVGVTLCIKGMHDVYCMCRTYLYCSLI